MTIRPPGFAPVPSPGHIKWLWREHDAKDAYDKVEAVIPEFVKVGCIASLKFAVCKALFLCAPVSGLDRLRAISTPSTSAPSFASGNAVVRRRIQAPAP